MDKELIDLVATELNAAFARTRFRSITQLGKHSFVLTFEGETFHRLFVSIEPRDPRIYLIRRRDREIKKVAVHSSLFAVAVDKVLASMPFKSLDCDKDERIIELSFGSFKLASHYILIVQLTGGSSNIFLVNSERTIIAAALASNKIGQAIGSKYAFHSNYSAKKGGTGSHSQISADGRSISGKLDLHFREIDEERAFQKFAESARAKNRQQIVKVERLIRNLENDLVVHGDAEKWKRFGDLLLASQSTAIRKHNVIKVVDVFDDEQPTIEIEADENDSLPEAAQKYFRRYTKARNARVVVHDRIRKAEKDKQRYANIGVEIENAIERKDLDYFANLSGSKSTITARPSRKSEVKPQPGVRNYISSDGFDIMIGKKSTDNDFLTFRLAHSRDTWLHAADYPGSHVVIRNANRKEIPQRTLIEAAQLAAFYSQGKKQTKAAVNYTQKKFVSKPKGSAPGLVRLASFKTILVEPVFPSVSAKNN